MKALVPVQLRQLQQRQLGLGGQAQAGKGVQLHAGQGGQALGVQKQDAALGKATLRFGGEAIKDRQAVQNVAPQLFIEGVAGQQAAATPGAE